MIYEKLKKSFCFVKIYYQNDSELQNAIKNATNYQFNLQKEIPIRVYCFLNAKTFQCTNLSIIINHIFFS